jgi:hypothetical protein
MSDNNVTVLLADGNNCGCSEARKLSCGHVYHCAQCGPDVADCGHVTQDAQATAELGFSATKIDGCGPSANISAWAAALNATGESQGKFRQYYA